MHLTPAAISEIARLGHVRLELSIGGCCGTYYRFTLEPGRPGDLLLPVGPGCLALSPAAAAAVRGAVLDYGASLKPPRFRLVRNPNTPVRCPCGRSFGQPFPGKSTPACQAYRPMEWLT